MPPVPGATFAVDEPDGVRQFGDELGWPLAVKAVHGGGGRGMRVVDGPRRSHRSAGHGATRGAASFGRPELYVERFLARPRHVEVQLVADHHGGLVVVGDRDCSIQRRYQKLIEEAPAPQPSRRRPRRARRSSGPRRPSRRLHQRRHDRVSRRRGRVLLPRDEHPHPGRAPGHRAGQRCRSRRRADPRRRWRAALVRAGGCRAARSSPSRCASTPKTPPTGASCPRPGSLRRFELPAGDHVRVDTGYRTGDSIPPEYDNLIAKVVVWGADREEARRRALEALRGLVVDGVPTTAAVAAAVLAHDDFRTVSHSTSWLVDNGDDAARRSPRRRRSAARLGPHAPGPPARCRCSAAGTAFPGSTTTGPRRRRVPATTASAARRRSATDAIGDRPVTAGPETAG